MRALALVIALAGAVRAEAPLCEPPPDVQAAIASARGTPDAAERLKQLVAAHPDDVFAHEAYADAASMEDYAGARAQYKALHEQHPADPRWAYLYARLVSYASAKEALALVKDLDYPRAHLMLAQRLSSQKDKPGARLELDKYSAACPSALDGWPLRLQLADKKAQPAAAARLRALLAARTDGAALATYSTLWKSEFGAVPPSRHAALRKQVAADLQRMRAATGEPTPSLMRAFDEGYKITADAAGQAWVKTQHTNDSQAFMRVFEDWLKSHPNPSENATRAERDAWAAAQFGASAEWVKSWPREQMAWSIRLSAAPRELPAAQVKAIAEKLLAIDDSAMDVASAYASRGIEVDKVPAMVARALAKSEHGWANQRAQPDRFTHMAEMLTEQEATLRFSAWETLSRAYASLHDLPKLRDVVAKLKALFDQDKPDDEMRKYHEIGYWNARARLAAAERKKADALSYFLKARALDSSGDDDELRGLWKELGGSDEGLAALTAGASKPAESDWKKKELALPAFSLGDLQGKTWKSSELKGKTVLLVSWATWCGPCKEELPHLEKLYQQTKKRSDLVIATLNIDFDVGLVQPFMQENKYTFPVLLTGEWASEQRGNGIPLTWIADRAFVVRLEKMGYDPSGKWVDDTLAAIDQVAKPQGRE